MYTCSYQHSREGGRQWHTVNQHLTILTCTRTQLKSDTHTLTTKPLHVYCRMKQTGAGHSYTIPPQQPSQTPPTLSLSTS